MAKNRKKGKKQKQKHKKKKIDLKEKLNLVVFSAIYFLFIIILNGYVELNYPGLQYIGSIPVKLSEGILYLAFMIWAIIATQMGYNYAQD